MRVRSNTDGRDGTHSRALVGLGLGGVPVAFNLFLEFLPSVGRGRYLVLFETFWAVGAVVEAGLAWAVFEPLGWYVPTDSFECVCVS